MDVSTSASGGTFVTPPAFVGLSSQFDSSPAAASLDSPNLQQTKSEIRSLAAELAQLAHTALAPSEFFGGFLPRLCAAMGAKAAAVWRVGPDSDTSLVAEHLLPDTLLADVRPSPLLQQRTTAAELTARLDAAHSRLASPAHDRILRCVIAEGQPILVPPGNVKIESERPSNPLSDAIIVIPVRVQENVEYLLQVIQRPSGGPAAQRGYLRFVAQMADLMADYLRRQQLRELTAGSQRLQRIEAWLTALAGVQQESQRCEMAADALRELLSADRAMVIAAHPRSKVLALSGSRRFDSRSEIVLAGEELHRKLLRSERVFEAGAEQGSAVCRGLWLQATERRTPAADGRDDQVAAGEAASHSVPPPHTQDAHSNGADSQTTGELGSDRQSEVGSDSSNGSEGMTAICPEPQLQQAIDAFCHAQGVQHAAIIPLDVSGRLWALLAYGDSTSQPADDLTQGGDGSILRLAQSIGGMIGYRNRTYDSLGWLATRLIGRRPSAAPLAFHRWTLRRVALELAMPWLLRLALVALLAVVAFFPVSQQISATAILQPRSKQMYYAPANAVVTQVLVDEGQAVVSGAPLLQLTSHELDNQLENLHIELTKTSGEIAEKTSRLNRGDGLSALQRDQLEFNLRELETARRSLQLQITNVQQRVDELNIQARAEGTIATWDLRNRLLNHPVQAGQLLASSFDPDDQWSLWISIPDHRAGLVATALDGAANKAVKVRFSLASHPDLVLEAFAADMAPQVTVHSGDPHASATRVVRTEAIIPNAAALPLKKDGAIARATIECGRVPLVWLVLRDAVWAITSRIRMFW